MDGGSWASGPLLSPLQDHLRFRKVRRIEMGGVQRLGMEKDMGSEAFDDGDVG